MLDAAAKNAGMPIASPAKANPVLWVGVGCFLVCAVVFLITPWHSLMQVGALIGLDAVWSIFVLTIAPKNRLGIYGLGVVLYAVVTVEALFMPWGSRLRVTAATAQSALGLLWLADFLFLRRKEIVRGILRLRRQ